MARQIFQSISLKFTDASPLVVPGRGVTVFVGPNNSGKSMVLRELEAALSTNGRLETKILDDFEISWPDEREIEQDSIRLRKRSPPGTPLGEVYVGRFRPDGRLEGGPVGKDSLINIVKQKQNKTWLASQFLRFFLIRLDGRTRFDLTNDRETGDLLGIPQNVLTHLFTD